MRNLRWNCQEGKKCYIEQVLPNWSIFNECFRPTKIRVTDVDGLVERNGQFLFIEVKQRKSIPQGQQILFKKLTHNAPHISVLVLYAPGAGQDMNIQAYTVFRAGQMKHEWTETDTKQIQGFITQWFQRAQNIQQR